MTEYLSPKLKAELKELARHHKTFEFIHGDIRFTYANGVLKAWDMNNKQVCEIKNWP
jgi:hypothetical protein